MIDELLFFSVAALFTGSGGSSSGFSSILIVIAVAVAIFAVLIISFMVIVIYCVIKKKRKKNTSIPYPTTSKSVDYVYDEIGKGTALSKDYDNAKSSDKDALYEYPKSSSGKTSDYDYMTPASFSMTKINDAYGVVNNNNSGNFPAMNANAAYAAIQTGNDGAVEDHIYSRADEL